jgi:CheY-like chemotaxis protein
MALIIVMEDDDGTRMLLASLLKKQGYDVMAADNGSKGLDLVLAHNPDLVISDVQMPQMNGLQMLALLRRNPLLAATPVILLTSLQERSVMRAGMNTGADDYITKPFKPNEVFEAVAAQLAKRTKQAGLQEQAYQVALATALQEQQRKLHNLYELSSSWKVSEAADTEPGQVPGLAPTSAPSSDQRLLDAVVLYADIADFSAVSSHLAGDELSALVKKIYAVASDTLRVFAATHVHFIGTGLLAVFANTAAAPDVGHSLRALRSALALAQALRELGLALQAEYPQRNLPTLDMPIALCAGPLTMTRLDNLQSGVPAQMLPIGAAVNLATVLQKQVAALGWPVGAEMTSLQAISPQVVTGRLGVASVPGISHLVELTEILAVKEPA